MGLYREDFGGGGAPRLGVSKPEERFCEKENDGARSEEEQNVRKR